MRGLILNNFYLVINNLKVNLIINAICLTLYIIFHNQITLFILIFVTILMLPSSCLNSVAVSRSSKWNYFEKSMPFERKTLLLSRYCTYFILSVISLLLIVVIGVLKKNLFGMQFTRITMDIMGLRTTTVGEMLKIYFFQSQLIGILYFPLIYLFKSDKMDVIILFSVIASLLIVFLVTSWNVFSLCFLSVCLYIISFVLSYLLIERERNNL